jgi:hypothetical protein
VWVASLKTGAITERAVKKLSICSGLYDGPGALTKSDASVEDHLAKIESAASVAIRKFAAAGIGKGNSIPPEISRFLAWQAARTPGWIELVQQWVNEPMLDAVVEPPPPGIENITDRARPLRLENPETGERREVLNQFEFDALRKQGWKWILCQADYLEGLHMQAWYFRVRHFPRLSWVRLQSPEGEFFITSDLGVSWLADGYADTPPAALRHPSAQIVAPLTRKVALVGHHGSDGLCVTPRQVNRFIAFAASSWIAGPTKDVVEKTLDDRQGQCLQ